MGFTTILGKLPPKSEKADKKDYILMPDYFMDLNLDQILEGILYEKKEYELKPYFYELAPDLDTILYRQEVLKEFENDDVKKALTHFSLRYKKAVAYKEYYENCDNDLQKERWYLDYHAKYCQAVMLLSEELDKHKFRAKGFKELTDWLHQYMKSDEFSKLYKATKSLNEKFMELSYSIHIEPNKVEFSVNRREEDYCDGVRTMLRVQEPEEEERYVQTPFSDMLTLSDLERRILARFIHQDAVLFTELGSYVKTQAHDFHPIITQLEKEVQFYLTFLKYEEKMKQMNFTFSYPEFVKDETMDILGFYDMALAWKNGSTKKPVIRNDAHLHGKEKFLVVTGPNQGGKTTFARAIGQSVYFALLGLKVPARQLKLPFYQGIMTHFATEESNKTGEGKLMEELTRLKPMMKDNTEKRAHNFVVINELFTSAASYDAFIMGRKVMEHFMEENSHGVYVTHIPELAKETDEIISMVAMLDAEDQKVRTYKIERRPADGCGYASTIVETYDLSYAQLKVRLSTLEKNQTS